MGGGGGWDPWRERQGENRQNGRDIDRQEIRVRRSLEEKRVPGRKIGGRGETSRECFEKVENSRGWCWEVLCASWSGEACVRIHNSHDQGGVRFCTRYIQGMRGSSKANGIRLVTLNIRSGRAGGLGGAASSEAR